MSNPQQLHGGPAAADVASRARLRELEAKIAALEQELSSARAALSEARSHGDTLMRVSASTASEARVSLTSSQAEDAALRQANAGLEEEGRMLRASEGQLVRLLDTAPIAILETDAVGTFVYANKIASNLLELTGLYVEGSRYDAIDWHLAWPDGRNVASADRPIARALRGQIVEELEILVTSPHNIGQGLVLRVAAVPVCGAGGEVEGALVTLIDVTARHGATAALQASEERSRLAFEIAGACAWELDPVTGLSTWDAAARTLLGLPESLPFDDAVVSFVHQDDRDRVRAAIASALNPGGDGRYSLEHRGAPGHEKPGTRWLQSHGQAYFWGAGPTRRVVRLVCVTTDVTQRRAAEERRALLVGELNHRVKNALAVVQALAEQTRRATDKRVPNSPEQRQFHVAFQSRLLALARAHDLLTREDWEGATLSDILASTIEPFTRGTQNDAAQRDEPARIQIAGPSVRVAPEAAVTLAMAIHELATNATKYGALSAPDGQVTVTWSILPDRTAVDLFWAEAGGPPISGPPPAERHGFGLRLLERGLARQLGGSVGLDFSASGLRCRMQLPLNEERVSPR
ncbi:hypothetical protein D9599_27620 [Roseomonas sp. KE2513]|nr:hypothetical protein [Roseomonas sp. KE2513]